jgi:hypothetical protein
MEVERERRSGGSHGNRRGHAGLGFLRRARGSSALFGEPLWRPCHRRRTHAGARPGRQRADATRRPSAAGSNRRRQRHGGSHPRQERRCHDQPGGSASHSRWRRAMAEACRILRRRGRLAFTDWVAPAPLAKDDADLLWEGQAVQSLESPKSNRDLLTEIGFRVRSSDDLTAQWAVLLKARLAMSSCGLRRRRPEPPSGHDAFHKSYVRLVDLMGAHVVGGVRIVAERKLRLPAPAGSPEPVTTARMVAAGLPANPFDTAPRRVRVSRVRSVWWRRTRGKPAFRGSWGAVWHRLAQRAAQRVGAR